MSKVTMDGIFVNGQQAVFHPENILSGDASAYTEEIGTAVEAWMEENVTGGEQVTDTTLTLPGVPADAKETGDRISAVKEELNSKITKPSEGEEGQILTNDGQGGAVWSPVGTPTDAQVGEAVGTWLDEHPEATTTVPDGAISTAKLQNGAITEEKFSDALKLAAIKDYVTPQMYGAVGDGSADDTEALNNAFASGHDVFVPKGTYLTTGVDITQSTHITFDNVTFIAKTAYQDYVINITASVFFKGLLMINGDFKAFNGIKFNAASNSVIDRINVDKCLAWGINLVASGHMTFKYIRASYCGSRQDITISYVSDYVASVDSTFTERQTALFESAYAKNFYIYDTSDYPSTLSGKFLRQAISYADGQLTFRSNAKNKIPSDYISKSCTVCFGGAVFVGEQCNSQINFQLVDTRLGGTGFTFTATYGHYIGAMYTQSDTIPIAVTTYSLGNYIGSFTAEGPKSGYIFVAFNYDYSVVVAKSTGYNANFKATDFGNISGSGFGRNITHLKSLSRMIQTLYYNAGEVLTVNDQSPNVILRNKNTFKIALEDAFQGKEAYNPFSVKTVYFMPSSERSDNITISLSDGLIAAGYSIEGGTDGVLTFARPSLWFKVHVVLFDKVFSISYEEMTKATPITT